MIQLIFTRRFVRLLAAWLLISAAVLGVAASCGDSGGGMWQGGSDSEPGWRR